MSLNDDDKEKMELMATEGEGDEIEKPKDTDKNNEDLDAASVIGKRTMEIILMNLNSYWIELIGSMTLCLSLIIYEIIGLFLITFIISVFQMIWPVKEDGEMVEEPPDPDKLFAFIIDLVFYKLGLKWFIFINLCQHMSVGFFCLTTFSNVFRETRNVKKFLIATTIKVLIFYGLTEFILQFIIRYLIGEKILKDAIEEVRKQDFLEDDEFFDQVHELIDKLIDTICLIIANFLGTFNTFFEKLVLGGLFIFLFHEPKNLSGNKLLIFRFLSLIPILYMIISIVLRALLNGKVIDINEIVLPILLGPKITIYGFFILTLLWIKRHSMHYNVFDKDKYIEPKIFSKVGSYMFSIFGFLELIIGLILPRLSFIGIGAKYLVILCAPVMVLYDYKKKKEIHCCCCKKKDFSLCVKLTINIIGYLIIILLGLIVFFIALYIFAFYIYPILVILYENFDLVLEALSFFI